MTTVAVLGVGKMGAAMAKELVAAGHQVAVWNRSADASQALATSVNSPLLTVAPDAKSAVSVADLAICTFTDGKVTQKVLLEDPATLADVKPNLIIADMGTSGVESAKVVDAALRAKHIAFIDAPVSGSVATIAAHQLLVMASGEESVVDRARPIFEAFAKKTAYLGNAGAGQAMKLAVNLIVHTLSAAVSEALALATANGIQAAAAYDVLEESVVAAPFVKYKRAAFLDPAAPVAMRIDTVGKDMGLINALGAASGVNLVGAKAIGELYLAAQKAGFEASDMAGLFRFISES
jgi:3-hydroxyisobutyrate dehydrogenase-like beta-hydroxyacid dehydrogenase